jgi:hypothetical protein
MRSNTTVIASTRDNRRRPAEVSCASAVDDMSAAEGGMDQQAMLRIRDRLQAIEDELVAADLDELMVTCDAGTFIWRTVARSRAEHGEEPPPAGYA